MSLVADTATLAHGYTMGDIDTLARAAARRIRSTQFSFAERYEHAWFGIVELLYGSTGAPTDSDLSNAGMRAISSAFSDELRHHGVPRGGANHSAPRFVAYWEVDNPELRPGTLRSVGTHDDFVDRLAERMALPRVLSLLSAEEYQAVAALAVHRNQEAAAAALGITFAVFRKRLTKARERFATAWMAPETPRVKGKRSDGLCKWGHVVADDPYIAVSGRIHCARCKRDSTRRSLRRHRERLRTEALASADGLN